MAELFFVLAAMVVLFFAILLVKELLKNRIKEFCVICTSVSLTWLSLLILYRLNIFDNAVLIALLIGGSTVGLFYLAERKVRKEWTMFRLPFLLTLVVIGYSLLSIPDDITRIIALLSLLWLVFWVAYLLRNKLGMAAAVKRVLECCKRW